MITYEQYIGEINAETCKKFIDFEIRKLSQPKRKAFSTGWRPIRDSKLAKESWVSEGCRLFKIPPHSPDLNPIENIFHLIGKQMKQDALDQNLERETYKAFRNRAKKTVLHFPTYVIDETIKSMPM